MGWASGSELAEDIWNLVKKHIPKKHRQLVAQDIIELFEFLDCDTIDEAQKLCKAAGRVPEEDDWENE